jgi:hypothetical protein
MMFAIVEKQNGNFFTGIILDQAGWSNSCSRSEQFYTRQEASDMICTICQMYKTACVDQFEIRPIKNYKLVIPRVRIDHESESSAMEALRKVVTEISVEEC